MKKLFISLILCSIIISAICIPTSITNADTGYYIVNSDITVYTKVDNNYYESFMIPDTYYFKILEQAGEYTRIHYLSNTTDLYLKTTDLEIKTSASNHEVAVPDYIITDVTFTNFTNLRPVNSTTAKTESTITNYTIYGLLEKSESKYICIKWENSEFRSNFCLIPAADSSLIDFSLDSVVDHINSQPPPQEPDSSIQGSTDTLSPVEPTNNLLRNILIGVIGVLCIIIVILLFKPNKKVKN